MNTPPEILKKISNKNKIHSKYHFLFIFTVIITFFADDPTYFINILTLICAIPHSFCYCRRQSTLSPIFYLTFFLSLSLDVCVSKHSHHFNHQHHHPLCRSMYITRTAASTHTNTSEMAFHCQPHP